MCTTNLIVTIMLGEDPSYHFAEQSFRFYAERVNADFIIISNAGELNSSIRPRNVFEVAMLQKLKLRGFLDLYERVLYVDADIIIHPNADNIFQRYSNEKMLYMFNEGLVSDRSRELRLIESVGQVEHSNDYYNVGVILFSRHAPLVDNIEEEIFSAIYQSSGFFEQTYINYWIKKNSVNVCNLDPAFNRMSVCGPREDRLAANFIHYAGHGYCRRSLRPLLIRSDYCRLFGARFNLREAITFYNQYFQYRAIRYLKKLISKFLIDAN